MYPFRNVLFPTDFSAHARAALKYAAAFAREGAGRVVLLSVQEGSVPANLLTMPERAFEEQGQDWLRELRAQLREHLADPMLEGLEVLPLLVEGEPAAEVARAVRDYEIDLVAAATRGRGRLAHALLGSTAEQIIAESSRPVLIVRPPQRDFVEHRDRRTEIRLNRVLLATNFRPSAQSAAHAAAEVVRASGAELYALYVIDDLMVQMAEMFPDIGGQTHRHLRSYVEENMRALVRQAGGNTVHTHVEEGRPYEQILRLAARHDIDLIVMGVSTHPSLFGGTPVLGPENERVLRSAPCPVLCVPSARAVTPLPLLVTEPVPTV